MNPFEILLSEAIDDEVPDLNPINLDHILGLTLILGLCLTPDQDLDQPVPNMVLAVTAKIEKRNPNQKTKMSSEAHQNATNVVADAIAIAPTIARNHRKIQVQKHNQNHHQMIVHLVRSKVTAQYWMVNVIKRRRQPQQQQRLAPLMQMVYV